MRKDFEAAVEKICTLPNSKHPPEIHQDFYDNWITAIEARLGETMEAKGARLVGKIDERFEEINNGVGFAAAESMKTDDTTEAESIAEAQSIKTEQVDPKSTTILDSIEKRMKLLNSPVFVSNEYGKIANASVGVLVGVDATTGVTTVEFDSGSKGRYQYELNVQIVDASKYSGNRRGARRRIQYTSRNDSEDEVEESVDNSLEVDAFGDNEEKATAEAVTLPAEYFKVISFYIDAYGLEGWKDFANKMQEGPYDGDGAMKFLLKKNADAEKRKLEEVETSLLEMGIQRVEDDGEGLDDQMTSGDTIAGDKEMGVDGAKDETADEVMLTEEDATKGALATQEEEAPLADDAMTAEGNALAEEDAATGEGGAQDEQDVLEGLADSDENIEFQEMLAIVQAYEDEHRV